MESHRTVWQCIETCDKIFDAEKDLVAHVKRAHENLMESNLIEMVKKTAVRSVSMTDKAACPICTQTMSLRLLVKHIGHHQEQLALFALPQNLEATEEENSDSGSLDRAQLSKDEDSDESEAHADLQQQEDDTGSAPIWLTDPLDRIYKFLWKQCKTWEVTKYHILPIAIVQADVLL